MQQPAVLESLCRLCLSTTLPIEFEHTAATIALLLASAPEARARLVSTVASPALQVEQWRPLRQTTALLASMVQGLLLDAQLLIQGNLQP